MQQHLMQMQPMMATHYPNNVTSDHIQQYLDENKSLILKIVESQNLGKLSECAENQARLQKNLMYLAAIADSQPQPPTLYPQYPSGGLFQPGAQYMQHHQAQQLTPQSAIAARSSMLYNQQAYLQQQQALHGQLGMSSGSAGLHMLQSETGNAGGSGALGAGGYGGFGRGSSGEGLHVGSRGMAGGSKQDTGSTEGRGGSSGSQGGETLYLKGGDDSN